MTRWHIVYGICNESMYLLFSFVLVRTELKPVAGPGFPVGSPHLVGGGGGRQLLTWLCFEFVCRNERIWTLGGHLPMQT